jgi:ethanolamine utilization microcompartment shell protein EutS
MSTGAEGAFGHAGVSGARAQSWTPAYQAYQILHVAFVAAPLLAGLDKFFHLLTDWTMYLSPTVAKLSPIPPDTMMRAVGVIESFSIASLIVAADTAAKTAEVTLIDLRLGLAIGGKAFVTMMGDVAAVQASVDAGAKGLEEQGLLVSKIVIPAPHRDLLRAMA